MSKHIKHNIVLKHKLNDDEFNAVAQLERICYERERTVLKLELGFKRHIMANSKDENLINDILYYIDGVLVGYISIFTMGSMTEAELNGVVHPDYRQQGVFKELHAEAMKVCRERRFKHMLLLSDKNSKIGVDFIKSLGIRYHHTEYQMEQKGLCDLPTTDNIALRMAEDKDIKAIWEMDIDYFGLSVESEPEDLEKLDENHLVYMIELGGKVIGKIRVEYAQGVSFIYGFGILPEYRGRGYGKETLIKTLKLINRQGIKKVELEVESSNENALKLYKSCGFDETSVMEYYLYKA